MSAKAVEASVKNKHTLPYILLTVRMLTSMYIGNLVDSASTDNALCISEFAMRLAFTRSFDDPDVSQ